MIDLLKDLPYSEDFEYSGFIEDGYINAFKGEVDASDSFTDKEIVFHTHPPLQLDYDEFPSELDVINFIFNPDNIVHIIATKSQYIIIEKSPEFAEIENLMQKKEDDDPSFFMEIEELIYSQNYIDVLNMYFEKLDIKLNLSALDWTKKWKYVLTEIFKFNLTQIKK